MITNVFWNIALSVERGGVYGPTIHCRLTAGLPENEDHATLHLTRVPRRKYLSCTDLAQRLLQTKQRFALELLPLQLKIGVRELQDDQEGVH